MKKPLGTPGGTPRDSLGRALIALTRRSSRKRAAPEPTRGIMRITLTRRGRQHCVRRPGTSATRFAADDYPHFGGDLELSVYPRVRRIWCGRREAGRCHVISSTSKTQAKQCSIKKALSLMTWTRYARQLREALARS